MQPVDAKVDKLLVSIRDVVQSNIDGEDEEEDLRKRMRALLTTLFPGGVLAVIKQPYIEELASVCSTAASIVTGTDLVALVPRSAARVLAGGVPPMPSLGEMVRSLGGVGVRVPGGFAVTADAYSAVLDQPDAPALVPTDVDQHPLAVRGDHVGILDRVGVDPLARLDMRHRLQPVVVGRQEHRRASLDEP